MNNAAEKNCRFEELAGNAKCARWRTQGGSVKSVCYVYWSFVNRFRPFRSSSALKFVRSKPIHWRSPRSQPQNTCPGMKDRTQDVHKKSGVQHPTQLQYVC